jgi:hypothetical protein
MSMLDAIIELRGELPEKCDFCGEPYNEHRHPTPDEGGEWACTECWARWDKEEAVIRARGEQK